MRQQGSCVLGCEASGGLWRAHRLHHLLPLPTAPAAGAEHLQGQVCTGKYSWAGIHSLRSLSDLPGLTRAQGAKVVTVSPMSRWGPWVADPEWQLEVGPGVSWPGGGGQSGGGVAQG